MFSKKRKMLHHKTYELKREAEWLVFIHGAGGSLATWKYQIDAFRPYFNLLLLDLRDHGRSKDIQPEFERYDFDIVTDDIIRVLDHLDIRRAHFMSLSLGSVILQKLDEKRPDLIGKMIMAGGVFRATLKIRFFVHSAKFLSYFLPYRVMYNLFSYIVLPRRNHRASRRMYRLQSQKLTSREYLKWVGLYKDFFHLLRRFFERNLENLSLVVMGAEDHVFFDAARRFAQTHQKVNLVVIDRCGHICNIEQHEHFNRAALDFLLGETAILQGGA